VIKFFSALVCPPRPRKEKQAAIIAIKNWIFNASLNLDILILNRWMRIPRQSAVELAFHDRHNV
jgi:hypothetical protein